MLKNILMIDHLDISILDLWNNPFGDKGMKAISKGICNLKNLVTLRVGNCDLTDEGFNCLFDNLKSINISVLNLSN